MKKNDYSPLEPARSNHHNSQRALFCLSLPLLRLLRLARLPPLLFFGLDCSGTIWLLDPLPPLASALSPECVLTYCMQRKMCNQNVCQNLMLEKVRTCMFFRSSAGMTRTVNAKKRKVACAVSSPVAQGRISVECQ